MNSATPTLEVVDISFVAIGRLMVDVWSQVSWNHFSAGDWIGENSEIKVEVGGPTHVCDGFLNMGGVHATLVSAIGASRTSSGSLGPDVLGELALDRLKSKGIRPSCLLMEHKQTGRVMMLYPTGGGRLMVSDAVTAPRVPGEYVEQAIEAAAADATRCLVYVDGYLYFDPEAQDVRESLARRPRGWNWLWVDVLPHTLYQNLSLAEFLAYTGSVDLVSMDYATITGFAARDRTPVDAVISAMCRQNALLALVDEDTVRICSARTIEKLTFPEADIAKLDRIPGYRDKLVVELITRFLMRNGARSCDRGNLRPRE